MANTFRSLLIILFLALPLISFAQRDTVYLDLNWKKTERAKAHYYRFAKKEYDLRYRVEEYYISGMPYSTGYYSVFGTGGKDEKEGYFIYYDSTGHKSSEGSYHKNLLSGTWQFYVSGTSILRSKENYRDGIRHGYSILFDTSVASVKTDKWTYYSNGSELYKVDMIGGFREGWVNYYDSATHNLKSKGEFHQDKKIGEWNFYYPQTGKIKSTENFKNGRLEGPYLAYYENGQIAEAGQYYKDLCVGSWQSYYADGKTKCKLEIDKIGSRGRLRFYDSATGEKITEGSLIDGKREGNWHFYYSNSNEKCDARYQNGLLQGKYSWYDSIGYKKYEGDYKNGAMNGLWTYYYDNSHNVWITEHFASDSLNGELNSYYSNGNLKRKETYANGKKTNGTCYDINGAEKPCSSFYLKAHFKGDVMTYIGKQLVYPERAKDAGVEGTVVVGFYVRTDGSLSDISVVKGLGYGCDGVAIGIVAEMPAWIPEQIDGRPIQSYHTLPIAFWKQ